MVTTTPELEEYWAALAEAAPGAHLLGPQADEIINVFAIAVRHGLTAPALRHMIYAYPTHSSDVPYMV